MSDPTFSPINPGLSGGARQLQNQTNINISLEASQKASKEVANELLVEQAESKESHAMSTPPQNPFQAKVKKKRKTLKAKVKKTDKADKKNRKGVKKIKRVEEAAEKANKRNPELQRRTLMNLLNNIDSHAKAPRILKEIHLMYPDPYLADEAIDFLEQCCEEGELRDEILKAKADINSRCAREIKAGRNISQAARDFSEKDLGDPTALRDMYRDITGNPRKPKVLFQELSEKFNYPQLKKVIQFFFHALGSDLRKGPSIPRAELQRLLSETRTLQAIFGLYNFFKVKMEKIQQWIKK